MNWFSKKFPAFLGSERENTPADRAFFHVIPAPLEQSVSYGRGTKHGPSAILTASQQLELFDGHSVPADRGIHTARPVNCRGSVAAVLARIERACAAALERAAVPVVLGGEHTVTCGVAPALQSHCGGIGIVQFDAHADLRDSYEGDPYSHATVMKRLLDRDIPIFQLGVRSMSPGEHELRQHRGIGHYDADMLASQGLPRNVLPADFPEKVYITFDIDAFSPALVPATGTPEPGGLEWYAAMGLLEKICREKTIVGFDVVELAPRPGLHAADFTAARLVYNIMGMITRKRFP
jgi:agmatinase